MGLRMRKQTAFKGYKGSPCSLYERIEFFARNNCRNRKSIDFAHAISSRSSVNEESIPYMYL